MLVFVPVFFFASEYAQIALGKIGPAGRPLSSVLLPRLRCNASQIGGRILDRRGAKRPVVIGCALAAVGFGLWAEQGYPAGFLVSGLATSSWPERAWGSC